ncbi:hypothetical protein L6452_32245 [Arctium lappa]|uniref:Uncharacterized protein n=1 Tax=Arctium lappa TaxID=4217 RepID=A0ACB8Z558_ARCLA|nr:hypothetical protein L6452_32245 [Arctium lappa]
MEVTDDEVWDYSVSDEDEEESSIPSEWLEEESFSDSEWVVKESCFNNGNIDNSGEKEVGIEETQKEGKNIRERGVGETEPDLAEKSSSELEKIDVVQPKKVEATEEAHPMIGVVESPIFKERRVNSKDTLLTTENEGVVRETSCKAAEETREEEMWAGEKAKKVGSCPSSGLVSSDQFKENERLPSPSKLDRGPNNKRKVGQLVS